MQSCRASITARSEVERKRDWTSNRPWILRCTIKPSTNMTGVPGQLYSGASLFATSRVYGRFDEVLGKYPKLSSDSRLLKVSDLSPSNSPQLYHELVFCACAGFTRLRYRLSYDLLEIVPDAQKALQATATQTAEIRSRLGLRLRRKRD